MKCYGFGSRERSGRAPAASLLHVLERVAAGTDTSKLVVAVYLAPGAHRTRGTAYVRRDMVPAEFRTGRGRWAVTLRYPAPPDLPERYALIRMRLDPDPAAYPRTERDGYGWVFRYGSFEDHLATLFAHELHHYRRHHLGFHPREGEHAANRWALETVRGLGFDVSATAPPPRRRRQTGLRLFSLVKKHDPHSRLRGLEPGRKVRILTDPRGRYKDQEAVLVRKVRLGAKRAVIRTGDGEVWRWPLAWMRPAEE
jgi:hypothetical protein